VQSTLQQTREKSETALITPWRVAYLGILFLSVAIYFRALTGTAIIDDYLLLNGYGINSPSLLHCFTQPFLGHYFRPLVSLSFYLDRAIAGGTPFFSHQVNILIHLLTTAALIGLLLKAFRSRKIALLGGLLFALQPAQVSAVAWIGGRTDSLCELFVALFAWALVAAVRAQGKPRTLYLTASAVAYAAALLTKEQTLALLPLVPLAFACFGDKESSQKRGAGWWATLPFAALSLVYTAVWMLFFNHQNMKMQGLPEHLAIVGRTLLYYALVLLAPIPHWQNMTSLGAMLRMGAWTIFAGYGLLLVCVVLFWRWRRSAPAAAWFLALALLAVLPVSNLIPVTTMTVAPYRAALAGIGIAGLLGGLLGQLWIGGLASWRGPAFKSAFVLLGLAYAGWCGGLTGWNAMQWSDQMHICRTLVRCDPDSLFARLNLIAVYLDANDPKQAGQEAEAALTHIFGSPIWRQPEAALRTYHTDPTIGAYIRYGLGNQSEPSAWISRFYSSLGTAWLARGNLQSSEACLAAGLQFDRTNLEINLAVGKYECAVGKYADAIPYLRYAQSSKPTLTDTYLLLGQAYTEQQQWAQAKAQFQTLIGLQPWLGPAYLGLAEAQKHLGDAAGAQSTLQTAQHKAILSADQAQRMLDSATHSAR